MKEAEKLLLDSLPDRYAKTPEEARAMGKLLACQVAAGAPAPTLTLPDPAHDPNPDHTDPNPNPGPKPLTRQAFSKRTASCRMQR